MSPLRVCRKAEEKDGRIDFGAKFLLTPLEKNLRLLLKFPVAKQTILCGEKLVLNEAAKNTGLGTTLIVTLLRFLDSVY